MVYPRHRPLLTRAVLLLSVVAWLLGIGTAEYHEHAIVHVACVEHGQEEEITGGQRGTSKRASLVAPQASQHEHACAFGCASSPVRATSAPSMAARVGVVVVPRPIVTELASAPRPPPLGYAPKTSPPSV